MTAQYAQPMPMGQYGQPSYGQPAFAGQPQYGQMAPNYAQAPVTSYAPASTTGARYMQQQPVTYAAPQPQQQQVMYAAPQAVAMPQPQYAAPQPAMSYLPPQQNYVQQPAINYAAPVAQPVTYAAQPVQQQQTVSYMPPPMMQQPVAMPSYQPAPIQYAAPAPIEYAAPQPQYIQHQPQYMPTYAEPATYAPQYAQPAQVYAAPQPAQQYYAQPAQQNYAQPMYAAQEAHMLPEATYTQPLHQHQQMEMQPQMQPQMMQQQQPDAAAQGIVKAEVGGWQICEDAQGEYYVHLASGQTFDEPPQELLQLLQ